MNISLKIISLLLSYPTIEIVEAIPELKEALAKDTLTGKQEKKLLTKLADDVAALDLFDAQERYVFLFDRTRTLSLHLFEHVHGESRDRGQAMVDLMEMYDDKGLELDANELPDYLPLFLEFVSTQAPSETTELLGQISHIIVALRQRLKKRKSIYANAFGALEMISQAKPDPALLDEMMAMPEDDPKDLEALDRIWEEEAVTFGGGAGENQCGPDRLRTVMRAHQRKPAESENARSGLGGQEHA